MTSLHIVWFLTITLATFPLLGQTREPSFSRSRSDNPSDWSDRFDRSRRSSREQPGMVLTSPAGRETSTPSPATEPASGVPGFGAPPATASVAGFGTTSDASSQGSTSGNANANDSRGRGFAEGFLARYDSNQDGVLDREEWSRMRRDPSAADQNQDGRITSEELSAWMANRSRERGGERQSGFGASGGFGPAGGFGPSESFGPSSGFGFSEGFGPPGGFGRSDEDRPRGEARSPNESASDSATSTSSTASTSTTRKSHRFLTAQERLPAGLPSWFTGLDANGDGQVAMAEYTQTWSEEKAREFAKFDLDGDGVITPQECLRSGKSPETSSSSSSGPPSTSGLSSSVAPPSPRPRSSSDSSASSGASERPKSKAWWMTP